MRSADQARWARDILQNEREVDVLAEELGFKQVIHLGYRNHFLDEAAPTELRAAGLSNPHPQNRHHHHLQPLGPLGGKSRSLHHRPSRRSRPLDGWHEQGLSRTASLRYAASLGQRPLLLDLRPRQPYNTVVDIAPHLDAKVAAMSANKAQGQRVPTAAASRNGWLVRASTYPLWVTMTRRPTASTSASLACVNTSASASPMAWTTPRHSTICRPAEPLPAR